jgi:hypothetical protein
LEIGCYWDKEGAPLFLNMVSTSKLPAYKEAKVKLMDGKKLVQAISMQAFKHTTALGIIMNGGLEKDYRPSRYVLMVGDKPADPLAVMWKQLGADLTIVSLDSLPTVNLRVHFVDLESKNVLKVAGADTVKIIIEKCKKKWVVRQQEGSAETEYGFFLLDEGTWLNEEAKAYTFCERKDIEFRKLGSLPEPVAAPLTEKEKKMHKERVEKEVNVFLQRRPPNSAPSNNTGKDDKSSKKGKYIDCCLNYDVIDFCLNFLEKREVLDLEGIYRISGNSDTVKHVWAALCLGHFDYLNWQSEAGDIAHVVTGACKLYLRELERPLLPFDTHKDFLACEAMADGSPEKLARVTELVDNLDDTSQHTLRRLMFHLWDVATFEKVNRMSPNNLAIVFGPTIMRPEVQDLQEMLNNSTKVDLCTYMIMKREVLFELDRLKPLTERMLGTKPDLELPEPSSRSSKVTMRKGKSRAQLSEDTKSLSNSPSASEKSLDKKAGGEKVEKEKESKRHGFHSITSRVKSATSVASQNPRAYTDCLQAMSSDLLPEMIAGSLVFTRQMEVDSKTFRKHLKGIPQETLIDVIHNLAKQVTASPSPSAARNVKTIAVGAPKAGLTSVSSASPQSSSPKTPVKQEDDVPKPQRAPPSISVEDTATEEESTSAADDEAAAEGGAAAVAAAGEPMAAVSESPEPSPVKPDEEDADVVIVNASEDNVEQEEEAGMLRPPSTSVLDLTVDVDSPGPVRFEPEEEEEPSEEEKKEEEVAVVEEVVEEAKEPQEEEEEVVEIVAEEEAAPPAKQEEVEEEVEEEVKEEEKKVEEPEVEEELPVAVDSPAKAEDKAEDEVAGMATENDLNVSNMRVFAVDSQEKKEEEEEAVKEEEPVAEEVVVEEQKEEEEAAVAFVEE